MTPILDLMRRHGNRAALRAPRLFSGHWMNQKVSAGFAPIIIGGSPRSGTSLLAGLLNQHPRIYCGPEFGVFCRPRKPKDLAAMSGLPVTEISAMLEGAPSYAAFLQTFGDRLLALHHKLRWAEKTPKSILNAGWALQALPGAKLIHVVRDGRDAICSLRVFDSKGTGIIKTWEDATRLWRRCVNAGLALENHPRYFRIHYEHIIAAPEETLRRLLDWLDEPFDPAVLPQMTQQDERVSPLFDSSVKRWQRDIPKPALTRIEREIGGLLKQLGYSE